MSNRVLLIDAGAAVSLRNWNEPKPTIRLIKDIRNLIEETMASRVVYCCDSGGSHFRKNLFQDYKKARRERSTQKPESEKAKDKIFYKEMDEFKEIIKLFGVEVVSVWGTEADDISGYLCNNVDLTDTKILMLSNDHDWLQLLRPGIVMRAYNHKQKFGPDSFKIPAKIWLNFSKFKAAYEFEPWQLAHAMSFSEDSDGLKTPQGLGKKFSYELIKKYGTIQEVEKNICNIKNDIKGFRKTAIDDLTNNFEQIYFNYKLVNLNYDEETKNEIFSADVQSNLNDVIGRFKDRPEVDRDAIYEWLFAQGQVNILAKFDSWVKVFEGDF